MHIHQMSPRSNHGSPLHGDPADILATAGETPLNLTKRRTAMSYYAELNDIQRQAIKTEMGSEGIMTVQPPTAHSNHTRSLLNPLPHPVIHPSLKVGPFASPMFISSPYGGLSVPSTLANIALPSLVPLTNSLSPDLIPSVFDKVCNFASFNVFIGSRIFASAW